MPVAGGLLLLQIGAGCDGAVMCRYGLNELSIQLNYLTKDLAKVLPPTDTRLRPDVRAVEQGEYAKVGCYLALQHRVHYLMNP